MEGGGIDGTAVHFVATRERQQLDERVIMCPLRWGSVLNLRRRRVDGKCDGNTLARTLLWDLYLPSEAAGMRRFVLHQLTAGAVHP